ncbi:hypothetical protein SASPL_130023 [Salvia splendens]|uniref:Uncharacterized protein n=1 Tax=Salvia splendens TaxID=180675 RepID=A0A8X8X844_SALSN|nr:hypothetical protein SASPL_130023 [Salvia splendens]
MKAKQACDLVAPLELPHSLHAFHRVCSTDDLNVAWMISISQLCNVKIMKKHTTGCWQELETLTGTALFWGTKSLNTSSTSPSRDAKSTEVMAD